MNKYTTLSEMSDKVNKLYDLLADARDLAEELRDDNRSNRQHLRDFSEEAVNEERPLTIPQRIQEASEQASAFDLVSQQIAICESMIGLHY